MAGGIALVVWFLLFAVLLFKKKKGTDTQATESNVEQQSKDLSDQYEEKPSLYELQIPESPGPIVKPKKFTIVPKKKPESKPPKKSVKDFSVQANGLNNQSNQTDTIEDDSVKKEIKILKGKIEALKNPSKIPRKHAVSNLFHKNHNGSMRSSVESVGIQSLSTSSSSIQTNDYTDSSTETSKVFVNTATDPMSKKRKSSFIQPEFISAATSPAMGSLSSIQSNSMSITPSTNDSEASSLLPSPEPSMSRQSSLEEGTDLNSSTISAQPPPVIISSPTPPLSSTNKLKDEAENNQNKTQSITEKSESSSLRTESDYFESSSEENVQEEEEDFDELENVSIKQSKAFKDQIPHLKNSFKLCIDSVRMLPDNALTFKITGKLLNLPDKGESSFSVYSELDWPYKSPRCTFEKVFNTEKKEVSRSAVLMMKLFTLDKITKKIAYTGYSVFNLMDGNGVLKGGGYQLQVYSGSPKPEKGKISNLQEKDVDKTKLIPCLTICIRLIEAEKSFTPRPLHRKAYYYMNSKSTKLEKKLFKHYFKIENYKKTLKAVCEAQKWIDFSESSNWLKKQYEDSSKLANLNLRLFNLNDVKKGVFVKITSAAGLPFTFEDTYLQCTVEVHGKKTKHITKQLALNSFQKHPKWNDKPILFIPGTTNKNTALILKLYGIYCNNNLQIDRKTMKMSLQKGKDIKLSSEKPLGWAVCPLFVDDCVDAAHHILPLFSGAPPEAFLKLMETRGPTSVLIKFALSKSIIKTFKTPAVIKVQLFDALYEETELFKEMKQDDERFLESVGIANKYHDLIEDGPKVNQLMANAFKDQNLAAPTNSQLNKAYDSLQGLFNKEFMKVVEN